MDDSSQAMTLPPNPALQEMFETGQVRLADGTRRRLSSATSPEECRCMYALLRKLQPEHAVEIGMAYGASALTILTALRENGSGRLTSIDPYPKFDSGRLSALGAIERSGLTHLHTHRHGYSHLELPQLVREGAQAQFVYIDGDHSYDGCFVDMYYSDLLLPVGGVLAFDDTGWRSVHKVIRHLLRTRNYRELDVGLKRNYRGRSIAGTALRMLEGRFGSSRYFEKVAA